MRVVYYLIRSVKTGASHSPLSHPLTASEVSCSSLSPTPSAQQKSFLVLQQLVHDHDSRGQYIVLGML